MRSGPFLFTMNDKITDIAEQKRQIITTVLEKFTFCIQIGVCVQECALACFDAVKHAQKRDKCKSIYHHASNIHTDTLYSMRKLVQNSNRFKMCFTVFASSPYQTENYQKWRLHNNVNDKRKIQKMKEKKVQRNSRIIFSHISTSIASLFHILFFITSIKSTVKTLHKTNI